MGDGRAAGGGGPAVDPEIAADDPLLDAGIGAGGGRAIRSLTVQHDSLSKEAA